MGRLAILLKDIPDLPHGGVGPGTVWGVKGGSTEKSIPYNLYA